MLRPAKLTLAAAEASSHVVLAALPSEVGHKAEVAERATPFHDKRCHHRCSISQLHARATTAPSPVPAASRQGKSRRAATAARGSPYMWTPSLRCRSLTVRIRRPRCQQHWLPVHRHLQLHRRHCRCGRRRRCRCHRLPRPQGPHHLGGRVRFA